MNQPAFSDAPQPAAAPQQIAQSAPYIQSQSEFTSAQTGGDDLVAQILRGATPSVQQSSFEQLIANARQGLGVEGFTSSQGDEDEGIVVDALDPIVANELLALIDDGNEQIKQISARVEAAKGVLKDAIEATGANTLKVNGVTVATYKMSADSRVLDQSQVKALFPDTPDNAELWKTQSGSKRFLLKR